MIGAQTIGNATLIAYDGVPILSTDPWLGSSDYAYFGSWCLNYEIPKNIRQDILDSKYIFFSHGHPDHLNPDSLHNFRNNHIIIGNHFGGRIQEDLIAQGFKVTVLKEKKWTVLSKNVSVMSLSTKIQDTILLVKIKDDIFINLNDAGPAYSGFIKNINKDFKRKFLLSISGWGDADMINFYDKDDNFIEPLAARKHPVGDYLSILAKSLGANYVIPFSSFHEYQREDSMWTNKYVTPIPEYSNGFHSDLNFVEPFSFIDSEKRDNIKKTQVQKSPLIVKKSNDFQDNWSDTLEKEDRKIVIDYFNKFEELKDSIGFINLIVGKKELNLKFDGPKSKGISFEVPRNSLVTACKFNVFDDLLIGNFMKTRLYNLNSLYDSDFNFNASVCKVGDNGMAYTKDEIKLYNKEYAKRMGMEYFYDLFANKSKNYFKFFFKNYADSKYYTHFRKFYYSVFK